MKRWVIMFVLVVSMLAAVACGDNKDENSDSGKALGSLDSAGKATLCETLVTESPSSCWQEENGWRIKADPVDESASCLGMLDSLNSDATIGEIEDCFISVDDTCDFASSDACTAVVPENAFN